MSTIQQYIIIGLGVLLLGLVGTIGVMKLQADVATAQIETLTTEKAAVQTKLDTAISVNASNAQVFTDFKTEVMRMSQIVLKNTLETQANRKAVADIQMEIASVPDPPATVLACPTPATDRAFDWLRQQPRSLTVDPGANLKGPG